LQQLELALGILRQRQQDAATSLKATEQAAAEDVKVAVVSHLAMAAKESDFLIRYYTPGQASPVMPKELQQFDQSARTWLAGVEYPRDLGNSLVSTIEKVAQQTKAMSPEQLEQYGFDEFAKLEHAYGPALDDKLRAAVRMVEDLDQKTPGLKNMLKSKGLGDNAMIASLLIQQGERYHARRGR
jgi:hypothetical protein